MISKQQFILLVLFFLFVQCNSNKGIISARGWAYNDKGSAYIITRNETVYYVNNMREWPERYLGKKIFLKGELSILYDTMTIGNIERQRIKVKRNIAPICYRRSIW